MAKDFIMNLHELKFCATECVPALADHVGDRRKDLDEAQGVIYAASTEELNPGSAAALSRAIDELQRHQSRTKTALDNTADGLKIIVDRHVNLETWIRDELKEYAENSKLEIGKY